MRKTIAIAATAGALLFGGAGLAHATVSGAPAPSATTTTLAQQDNANDNDHSDKTGLWGLVGLLGLGGLLGLRKRNDTNRGTGSAAPGTAPRGTVR